MNKPKNNGTFIDIEGMTFGRLTVVSYAGSVKKLAHWNCRCTCGKELSVRGNSLRTGNTNSCGCIKQVNAALIAQKFNRTHGQYRSPTYFSWQAMLARCNRKSHKSYKYYGGRGVTVCQEWHSFETFLADMGTRPDGTTLDRIDNGGNYSPTNCKWSTPKEQANNRRKPASRISECGLHKTDQRRDGRAVWAAA